MPPNERPPIDTITVDEDRQRHLEGRDTFRVTHLRASGPKGGAPTRTEMTVDEAGLRMLVDTLPPGDRIRLPTGQELACRGTGASQSLDAMVPILPADLVHLEALRRFHRATLDDMEAVRRSALSGVNEALKSAAETTKIIGALTCDTLKVVGALSDQMQAVRENCDEQIAKAQATASGDITDKITDAVLTALTSPGGGGLGALLSAARGARAG